MLDESLLDAPEALARADRRGLLRGAAEAGARVRTAARHAAEAGHRRRCKPDGRPRAVLVAGPGTAAAGVADLLGALGRRRRPGHPARAPPASPPPPAPCAGRCPAGRAPWTCCSSPPPTAPNRASPSSPSRRTAAAAPSSPSPRRGSPLAEAVDGAARPGPSRMATAPHERGRRTGSRRSRPRTRRPVGAAHPAARPPRPGRPARPRPPETLQKVADRLDQRRRALRPGHRHVQQPGQDPRRRTRRRAPADLDARAPAPAPPAAASPPPSPSSPAAPPSPPNCPRRSPRTAPCSPARSPPAPTPTTSSATGSRSRRRCTRASCCSATGPIGGLTAAPAARELALSHDTADQRARTGGRAASWRPLAELDRHHRFRRRLPGARPTGSLTIDRCTTARPAPRHTP